MYVVWEGFTNYVKTRKGCNTQSSLTKTFFGLWSVQRKSWRDILDVHKGSHYWFEKNLRKICSQIVLSKTVLEMYQTRHVTSILFWS